jgi:hypothetical protein
MQSKIILDANLLLLLLLLPCCTDCEPPIRPPADATSFWLWWPDAWQHVLRPTSWHASAL